MAKEIFGGIKMKITVLENINFSEEQKKRLISIVENGSIEYYDYTDDIDLQTAKEKVSNSDVVVVNWIDPSPFILSMKPNSMISLLSTGFGWIQNLEEGKKKGVMVSNIPAYSTEAVAEHIFALLLSFNKRIMISSNYSKNVFKSDEKTLSLIGTELKGKTIGIIGLGNIGNRVAEISTAFDMKIVTYNRTKKNHYGCVDVTLKELLATSDIICITCPLNDESRGLINETNIKCIKKNAMITGTTWGVVDEVALIYALDLGILSGAAFDLALEGPQKLKNTELLQNKKFFCTFHNAYNTVEAEKRQLDICIDNIEAFLKGEAKNIIN